MNDNERALNAFIANIAQIDNIARHFLDYADTHGYIEPDDVTWATVGATAEIVRQLSEAAAFAGIDLTTDLEDFRDTFQQSPDIELNYTSLSRTNVDICLDTIAYARPKTVAGCWARLNRILAAGEITQEQYDEIKANADFVIAD